jgi:polyferredoxin
VWQRPKSQKPIGSTAAFEKQELNRRAQSKRALSLAYRAATIVLAFGGVVSLLTGVQLPMIVPLHPCDVACFPQYPPGAPMSFVIFGATMLLASLAMVLARGQRPS